MKRVWRKLLVLAAALALLLTLLPAAAGAQSLYFMVVNDKVLDYSASTMPVMVDGTIYIPYHTFIGEYNGGVDLGVFYGISDRYNTLSLYSRSNPILTFDINAGTAYDATGNTYSFRAIVRNGVIFVPAWAVCSYFGLQFSQLTNSYGVMIRVKKEGSFWLSDRVLSSSASLVFEKQKQLFDREQLPQPTASDSPSPSPSPSDTPTDKSRVQVSFAFRCGGELGPESVLDTLARYQLRALFLLRPSDLSQWDDAVRRLLAEGHRLGLLVEGETAEECLEQAQEGNRLLSHIARSRTDLLLAEGPDGLTEELRQAGWVCWRGNVSGIPTQDIRPASLAANILLNVEVKRSYARILMDNSATCVSALARLLPELERQGYLFHTITEIDLR